MNNYYIIKTKFELKHLIINQFFIHTLITGNSNNYYEILSNRKLLFK